MDEKQAQKLLAETEVGMKSYGLDGYASRAVVIAAIQKAFEQGQQGERDRVAACLV